MSRSTSEKKILIIDNRGPEKTVLTSILTRLGYEVFATSLIEELKELLTKSPNLVIVNGEIEGAEEAAISIATQGCRLILLSPPHENAPDFIGFVDTTEHILRGIGVTIPEIVMVVNDFISPLPGKGIKRQPRVPGGYRAEVTINGEKTKGFIFNLSASGAFVELSHPPQSKTELLLEFNLPGHEDMFRFKSKVTWRVLPDESSAMRSPPGCGVFFMDISPEDQKFLEEFVIHKGRN